MINDYKIAVIIPCYNEEKTIERVILDFKTVLPDSSIFVYDNNSSDHTGEIAAQTGAIVIPAPVQGKGNVIRQAFYEIDADCYILVDGDDTYGADCAPTMVTDVLERKADMVIGDRLSGSYFTENKRKFHNSGNKFVKNTINKLFGVNYSDIMTGFRAFSKSFVKTFPVLSEGFEIETEMSIYAADKRLYVINEPCSYKDRPEGSSSKLNTIPDGMRVIRTIVKMVRLYKPLFFFGLIALILIGLGIGFMIPVVWDYSVTKTVEKFPTLIVCGFAVLAGIESLFTGLILTSVHTSNCRQYEQQRILVNTIDKTNR